MNLLPFLGAGPRFLLVATVALVAASSGAAPPDNRLPPLTTVEHAPRIPGKFVWADLVTDDAKAARAFYGRLFNWTFREVGNYTIAQNEERPLCGFIQQPKPKDRPAQPRWFAYLSVSSVGRAESAVTKAGGRVLARGTKYPDRGEQAVFADAEGAIFGVVKSSAGDPQDFLPDNGDWVWIQLLSRDAKKAAEFYRRVGNYDVVENTSPDRLNDYVLASDGFARATIRSVPTANTQTKPAWLPFVRVKNIGESIARAKELGGKTLLEPKPELFHGKVAVLADSTGGAIGILEWQGELQKGGK